MPSCQGFMARFNARFAVAPACPTDLHRKLNMSAERLRDVLCHRVVRHVGAQLTHLIHRIAGIRWRVSHKGLILFTDWVSRPFHSSDHTEPHPPCTTIRLSRSGFQPSDARKSLLRSMVAVSPRMAV